MATPHPPVAPHATAPTKHPGHTGTTGPKHTQHHLERHHHDTTQARPLGAKPHHRPAWDGHNTIYQWQHQQWLTNLYKKEERLWKPRRRADESAYDYQHQTQHIYRS